jgi:hypothetical protein
MFHDRVVEDILEERVVSSRNRRNPRGVKRKMSTFPVRRSRLKLIPKLDLQLVSIRKLYSIEIVVISKI